MTRGLAERTLLSMNDLGLLVAALLGMVLTAGAIVRDTRNRAGLPAPRLVRVTPSAGPSVSRPAGRPAG